MVEITWLLLTVLLLGGASLAARCARETWKGGSLRDAVGLTLIAAMFGVAIYVRLRVVTFHHAMYLDEPWYEEAAKNLLRTGTLRICEASGSGETCTSYVKSVGWPAILALAFRVGGVSERVAFLTSALLGACAAPLAAAAVRCAGGSWPQALLAATLLAIHPLHAQWSGTTETNVAGVTLLLCGLTGALSWSHTRSVAAAVVGAGGLGAAAAVRPEMWLTFVPVGLLALERGRRDPCARSGATVLVLGAVLGALPGIWSLNTFLVHSRGVLFQWASIPENARAWVFAANEGGPLSGAVAIAALAGAVMSLRRRRFDLVLLLGGAALLTGLFVLFYYPPVAFYARTMLGALAPAAILAVLALPLSESRLAVAVSIALSGVLIVGAWSHREAYRQASDTQLNETALPDLARGVHWPARTLVLAEWPTVLEATTDLEVMSTASALEHGADALALEAQRRPIFLTCDMYCEPNFMGSITPPACAQILKQFALEVVLTTSGPHRNYGFFRITGRRHEPPVSPICPLVP